MTRSDTRPRAATTDDTAFRANLARSRRLLAAFRREQVDPDFCYSVMARDTVGQLGCYVDLAGATVADVGAGPGYLAEALRAAGARVICVDIDINKLSARDGETPPNGIVGSAMRLPLRTGSVDICLSSNVLEHVPEPFTMTDEMLRVTRPGGIVFLAYTNWLSPWGGHETSPWHYLGGLRAAHRFHRRTGRPPENYLGRNLFPVSVAAGLRWAGTQTGADLVDRRPRYLPSYLRAVVAIPVLREFVTWNLLLVLRKR